MRSKKLPSTKLLMGGWVRDALSQAVCAVIAVAAQLGGIGRVSYGFGSVEREAAQLYLATNKKKEVSKKSDLP